MKMGILLAALVCMAMIAPVSAQPIPFMINGWVSGEGGIPCENPVVHITNLNTSEGWTATTSGASNYYQLILDSGNLEAGSVLRFSVTDGSHSTTLDYEVAESEIDAGGVFSLNHTIVMKGDLNGDGEITPADAAIALKMAVSGKWSEEADVSGDHQVTSLDALMILQAAARNL